MHKLNTDDTLESVETSPPMEATDTDPQTVTKKKRRRSRRRGKGGGNAAKSASAESATPPTEATDNEAVVPLPSKKAQPRPDAAARSDGQKAKGSSRKRRGENGSRKGTNGGKRLDIGSWRAEPHNERMRRKPGQAQAQSPSLWAGWSAAHFGKDGSSDND